MNIINSTLIQDHKTPIDSHTYEVDKKSPIYTYNVKKKANPEIKVMSLTLFGVGLLFGTVFALFGTLAPNMGIGFGIAAFCIINATCWTMITIFYFEMKATAKLNTERELYNYDAFRDEVAMIVGVPVTENNLSNDKIWEYHTGKSKDIFLTQN